MTLGTPDSPVITTLGVYRLDAEHADLPALDDIEALVRLLGSEAMARGPARQVLTLLGQDQDDARRRYARWREIMRDRDNACLKELDALLERLCNGVANDLPVSTDGVPRKTPLGDAATLLAVMQGSPVRPRSVAREIA